MTACLEPPLATVEVAHLQGQLDELLMDSAVTA